MTLFGSWPIGFDTLLCSYFTLTVLFCPNLVPLLLVGWQFPPRKLTIASEYLAGMKPLATFWATINSFSIRNRILLITPCVHILSHRRRSLLEQCRYKNDGAKFALALWLTSASTWLWHVLQSHLWKKQHYNYSCFLGEARGDPFTVFWPRAIRSITERHFSSKRGFSSCHEKRSLVLHKIYQRSYKSLGRGHFFCCCSSDLSFSATISFLE